MLLFVCQRTALRQVLAPPVAGASTHAWQRGRSIGRHYSQCSIACTSLPPTCAGNVNWVVLPEYGCQAALTAVLLLTGHWLYGGLHAVLLAYHVRQVRWAAVLRLPAKWAAVGNA